MAIGFALYAVVVERQATVPPCKAERSPPPQYWAPDAAETERSKQLFRGLSEDEFQEVVRFLLRRDDLNLTASSAATLNSNYIYMIEHYLPPKDDILPYLQSGTGPAAMRRAKAVLFMGALEPRSVREYLVFPVPHPARIEPLVSPSGGWPAWNARPVCNVVEGDVVRRFLSAELGKIRRILVDSFGQWVGDDCAGACLYPLIMTRAKPGSPDRRVQVEFYVDPSSAEGYYLCPVPLVVSLVAPPSAPDHFRLEHIYYSNKHFSSVDELSAAYDSGSVERATPPPLERLRGQYGSPRRRGNDMNGEQLRPPSPVSPDGRRFAVDQRRIDYLGWSFDLYFRTVSGLEVFNVRYKNESVAFEIGMQDIVVIYGGVEPHNFFKTFFDAGYSLGTLSYPLIRGVDCPADATYVDSVVYALGSDHGKKMKDAACVFEHVNSVPIRRHFSGDPSAFSYAFGMADSVLVVRQAITVWNYDYVFDYEFHQNGVIDVRVSSSGYVVVTNTDDARYGLKLSSVINTLANVHGHYFHFKLDIDAADVQNSLTYVTIELENTTHPMVDGQFSQMRIVQRHPATEKQSLLSYDFTKPKHVIVHSNRRNNTLGYRRGYRIVSSSFADVMLPLTNPQMKGASWTKHQLAVTKQKDVERSTASIYTQGDPSDPFVDFQTFYNDDESIRDEDVVAWVTLGTHHLPSAEDLPVTTTAGKVVVASLVPFNFFEEDPSISSRDAAVITRSESGELRALPNLNRTDQCIALTHRVSILVSGAT